MPRYPIGHDIVADRLQVREAQINTPSAVTSITAAGGITATAAHMRIDGNGGAIIITANPQIVAGVDGQVIVLEGDDDTNTVEIQDGTGLHLHGGNMTIGEHDMIMLTYDTSASQWQELSRNSQSTEKEWSITSNSVGAATTYYGGYYFLNNGNDDFSPGAVNFGTADIAYGAHFFVVLGANTDDEIEITVTGTSITDGATRVDPDTEVITIPHPSLVDAYFETTKKWIGTIAIQTTSGTAKDCNYGYVKYWDNQNTNFRVLGLDFTWNGGQNDAAPEVELIYHRSSGWTYNAGAEPTPPTPLASMSVDYVTEKQIANNQSGAWKRTDLSQNVNGGNGEGTIIRVTTTAARTFDSGNFLLRIRPN